MLDHSFSVTHVFGETITKTSKNHDLFNSIQIIHNRIYWNPLERMNE